MKTVIATVDRRDWPGIETVFGTRGDPSRCWCQYFVRTDWSAEQAAENKADLRRQVRVDEPTAGLLATVGGEPAGWVQVGPRGRYARLNRTGPPSPDEWVVTCFVIRPEFRRRGLARELLRAAVDHAKAEGAGTLRAYPVDTGGARRAGADLYTGVLSTFVGEGFSEVGMHGNRVTVELSLR